MLNKKIILILTIFIVSLFAISSISAADNATSDAVSVEETTDAISVDEADEVVSAEDNQVIIGNESNVGTFDELSSLIGTTSEGSTLELDKDYKYVNGSTEGIQINKAITIDGKGHILDSNQLSRLFYVNANNVVLKDITLKNACIKDNGGAIIWSGNDGVINSCNFVNCSNLINPRKDSYSGGAIYLTGNNMNISYCNFTDNKAWDGASIAIYSLNSYISCCNFINNFAQYRSGAISIHGDNHKFLNCNFINNAAEDMAGVIEAYGDSIELRDCLFLNNSGEDTGAVMLDGYDNHIYGCNFTNNSAKYNGALYLAGSYDSYVINCTFKNNYATEHCDALRITNCDNIHINDCDFINVVGNHQTVLLEVNEDIYFSYCSFYPEFGNIEGSGSCDVVNIIKKNSYLTMNNYTVNYGDEIIGFALLKNYNNVAFFSNYTIIFELSNRDVQRAFYSTSNKEGVINFPNELSQLQSGIWNVTVIFNGNDNYAPCNATATITVLPPSSSLTIDDVNATVGHEANLNAKIIGSDKKPINEGVVTFFDGETNIGEANVYDGVATLTYTPTTAGEHSINAVFNSVNYGSSNNSAIVSVAKANVDLNIKNIGEVYFSTPSNFAVSVNSNSRNVNEGEVKFYVNNVLVGSSEVRDGIADFNYITNATGSFILTVTYNGTDNYLPANIEGGFQVNKMPTTLTGESVIFDEEAYKTFTTELKDDNNNGVNGKPVKIEVIKYSGESATFNGISDSNGITVYDVGRLAGGMWYVTGIYAGDKNYIKSSFVDKFIVVKMNTTTDIEEISNPKINHNYKLKANIHDEDGKLVKEGIVQFYLDGVDIGSIDLSNNQGHQSALGEGVLGASDSMFEYELGAENDVYLNYVPTKAGKHTLTAVYEGTTLYRSSNSTTILDVSNSNKNGVTITAPTVNTVYNGGKYLVVTLKDAGTGKAISGVNVKVVLNGKTSNPTTNKNGQVKVSTNGLAPKNYTAKITFAGNSKYDKLSESAKVVVTKATPKMTAKATTFKKSDKTKKYTVTLKTNKNKVMKNTKVTLKVNGKTYSAKTNTKGQATFKLTKLTKKGKFTAVVKYAGSKYYNAKTVKPKITVK